MDDEKRPSSSGENRWDLGGFSGGIPNKEEAYKAVYADKRKKEEVGTDPEDDIFNEWAENLEEEVREEELASGGRAAEPLTEETAEVGSADEESPAEENAEAESADEESPAEGNAEAESADEESPAEETAEAGSADEEPPAEETAEAESAAEESLTEETEPSSDEKEESDGDAGAAGPSESKDSVGGLGFFGIDREDPEKQKRRRKMIGLLGAGLLLLLVGGSQLHRHYKEYYSTHFFRGTVIDGHDVSKMTVDEVKDVIKENVSRYVLKIKELDRKEKITAADVQLEYVDDGKIDELMEKQEEGKWLFHLAGSESFDINAGTKYNEEKANEKIASLECFKEENVTKPQDATLKDENNVFSIQAEVEGNEVNIEKLTKAVTDALKKGETSIDIVKNDCYNHPTVFRNDETLKARMDKWNEYMRVNVTYAFGDNIETVNGDTVKPNVVDDGTNVELPTDWIRTLVYDWGQKYDTFGLARPFTTHSGEEVMIEEGGDYGWVIDKDVTIADVTDAVLTGAQGERTPTFLYSAMGWDNGDLTGTYVEVSISEQHLWCYKDYELVIDTDVVTGLPTKERETTRGCFAIDAKKEDAVLGSLDVQGYASPVSFWAPFNGGQGLHDAPWRDEFGGDIYESNGSHGCVNIPPWNMEAIYNAIEIGNAVVIY